jgi:hypothetical protein
MWRDCKIFCLIILIVGLNKISIPTSFRPLPTSPKERSYKFKVPPSEGFREVIPATIV